MTVSDKLQEATFYVASYVIPEHICSGGFFTF